MILAIHLILTIPTVRCQYNNDFQTFMDYEIYPNQLKTFQPQSYEYHLPVIMNYRRQEDVCVDEPTWYDRYGDDCSYYNSEMRCRHAGDGPRNACCFCGGGIRQKKKTSQNEKYPWCAPNGKSSKTSGHRYKIQCANGELCDIYQDGWSCCGSSDRVRCPEVNPFMCAQSNACGVGRKYHCCAQSEKYCNKYGGLRPCPEDCDGVMIWGEWEDEEGKVHTTGECVKI